MDESNRFARFRERVPIPDATRAPLILITVYWLKFSDETGPKQGRMIDSALLVLLQTF